MTAGAPSPLLPGTPFDVVIEIPRGSRNKYEYDHDKHIIRLDRRLFSATVYPSDYGFVPDTLALDGDPLDVLVLLEDPTFPGCWVEVRAVGVFWMEDEKGPDAKILCVPSHDPAYETVDDIADLPKRLLDEIEHFFDVYKMLEPEKNSTTRGYEGGDVAYAEIDASRLRFQSSA
jgi:inorganic pyrophosphatase